LKAPSSSSKTPRTCTTPDTFDSGGTREIITPLARELSPNDRRSAVFSIDWISKQSEHLPVYSPRRRKFCRNVCTTGSGMM
jgi:hypothetical protein